MKDIIRFFLDETQGNPAEGGILFNESVEMMPGQKTKQIVFGVFAPFNPQHLYKVEAVEVSGDARLAEDWKPPEHKLQADASFPIMIEWTAKEQSPDELTPLDAGIKVIGRVIAPARMRQ